MKLVILSLMLTIFSNYSLSHTVIVINNFATNAIKKNCEICNNHLSDTHTIDIKRQVRIARQVESSFSAPAVGEMLLDYYHEFTNVNQDYLAYQMHTNVNHIGTNCDDFYDFLVSQIKYEYIIRRVPLHFGNTLRSIEYFIYQVYYDLQHNVLPILTLNGYLPNFGSAHNHYVVINGIYGDLTRPAEITFEYLNTWPGNPSQGNFIGHQLSLLWKDALGYYFGIPNN